ncbi:MAG: hypothetical protein NTX22_03055 [Ignavibacteriales bacterium]|nr:hypothetical protein [Ignavibacteriales bacterium]
MSLSFKKYFLLFILPIVFGCDRVTSNNFNDDGLPPAVPANLNIFYAQDGTIGLEWKRNSEVDLKGYNIYRSINDTANFIKIYFTSSDYFYNDSLYYDSTYYYYISAVDNENKESRRSNIVSEKPINYKAPDTPRNLEINARNWIDSISIFLKWDANFESDVAGYLVFRSESPDFNPDNNTFIGNTKVNSFTDKNNLELYKIYYFKIKAIDKGGLESNSSLQVSDLILGTPKILFPKDNSTVNYFTNFLITALPFPTRYKIVVQTNQYFGEIWSKEFESSVVNDTISISFDANYITANTIYYWRIATYSANSLEPNSITNLFSFIIKQ